MRLFDWFRGRKGGGGLKPAQACLLFVDGENGPPDPLLLVEAVERHAGMHPEVKIAYGKWNLLAKNTQKFGEAGFERVLADKGSNNADLMLSLKALREVQDRSQQGQTGAIYIAFKDDKGFAHLFNHALTKGGLFLVVACVAFLSRDGGPVELPDQLNEVIPFFTQSKVAALVR